jgi:hypothetical protein
MALPLSARKMRVQVGNQDFELELLFYHRDLQCLVAFELKTVPSNPNIWASWPSTWKRLTGTESAHMRTQASAFCFAAAKTTRSWNMP